nr:translocase of chloroplast 90, chloroplastic [Ipomoea batatas]
MCGLGCSVIVWIELLSHCKVWEQINGGIMSFKDWVLSQLVSKTLASSRPLSTSESFLSPESPNEEYQNQVCTTNVAVLPASSNTSYSSNNNPENHNQLPSEQVFDEISCQSSSNVVEKNPIVRIEQLQIKFLRALHRLGLPLDNIMVSKVLYRIHLATMIRAGESDLKRCNLKIEKAREIAAEQEGFGQPELDVSFKVLLLGKTGVGKSSTINSIFDQNKAMTNAFHPATKHVQEITGTVKGVKISFIDTPGLLPSSPSTARRNRKILRSVKRYVRKNPPDLVLYFERFDLINVGYSDFPLLRLVTEVFGPAIWFNTVLVMTHSSSALPEGPHGYPVTFESYVTHCTDLVQHYIHQAVSDTKLENPVILVENHPHCKTNDAGEKLLPNGQVWRFQFLLTCLCTKVLGDVNSLLDFGNRIKLGPSSVSRLPSLPHLLSSFLKHRAQLTDTGTEDVVDEVCFLESDEEDEYDQLPPIRVLTKAQYKKLSPQHKNDYLDELDYRETLYLKKQMKEEARQRREALRSQSGISAPNGDSDGQQECPEAVLLPDMDIPPSFSSDYPVHRYRCLTTSDQWLARPVLDPHGWDHEVSFDGINLETTAKVTKNISASVTGQMSKDKQDFSIQSKCTAAYSDPSDPRASVYTAGLDIQSARQELICSLHSNALARTLKHNITECGVSLTSFGGNYFLGTKVEDSFTIGKRLKFTVTGGRMGGARQAALGGSFGATLRGRDYPVRNESVSFTMTLLSFNKETVLSGNLQSDLRLSRGTNVSVNANLNSQKMGQVSIKTSSCEHMEIAFIAVFSILRGLLRRKVTDHGSTGTLETGSSL